MLMQVNEIMYTAAHSDFIAATPGGNVEAALEISLQQSILDDVGDSVMIFVTILLMYIRY